MFCFICLYLKFFCKVKRNDFYIIFMRLIIVVRWVDKYEDLISRCQLGGWRFSPERHLLDWMLKCTTTRVTNKFSLQLFGSDVHISRAPRTKKHIMPGDSKSWLCYTARCLSCKWNPRWMPNKLNYASMFLNCARFGNRYGDWKLKKVTSHGINLIMIKITRTNLS